MTFDYDFDNPELTPQDWNFAYDKERFRKAQERWMKSLDDNHPLKTNLLHEIPVWKNNG